MNPGFLGLGTALSWGTSDFMARLSGRAVGPGRTLLAVFAISSLLLTPFGFSVVGAMLDDGALSLLVGVTGLSVLP